MWLTTQKLPKILQSIMQNYFMNLVSVHTHKQKRNSMFKIKDKERERSDSGEVRGKKRAKECFAGSKNPSNALNIPAL